MFVTPRPWPGKQKWAKEKEALGEWKSVRAYDASDLEQWLEQSLHAQGWLAEQIGMPTEALDLALAWPTQNEDTLGDLIESLYHLEVEDQIKVWDLVDTWIKTEDDDQARAKLRERIRRFAFTRRGKRRKLKNETRDRALKAYRLLTPRDLIMRHQWLFAKTWVDESTEEFEDENFDYRKREEKIRRLRIDALKEIWTAQKFEGIHRC